MTVLAVTRGGEGDLWLFNSEREALDAPLFQYGDIVARNERDLLDRWGLRDLAMLVRKTENQTLVSRYYERAKALGLRAVERLTRREREEIAKAIWPALVSAGRTPPTSLEELNRIIRTDRRSTVKQEQELNMSDTAVNEAPVKGTRTRTIIPRDSIIQFASDAEGTPYDPETNNPRHRTAAEKFKLYRAGMTVREALDAGLRIVDVHWDITHKFIELKDAA